MHGKKNLVQAIAIDYQKIYTICCNPLCGDHIHMYSSQTNLKNRYLNVPSICLEDTGKDICIRIDSTTKRTSVNYYANRCITFSSRKFEKQKKRLWDLNQKKRLKPIKEEEEVENQPQMLIVNFD